MSSAYCSRSMESLLQSEDAICAKKYRFREDIDIDFFGSSGLRQQNRNLEIERWVREQVQARLDDFGSKPFGGVRRAMARFPRREFRKDLIAQFGYGAPTAIGALTLFMILYYIVVAIYWWRRLR